MDYIYLPCFLVGDYVSTNSYAVVLEHNNIIMF